MEQYTEISLNDFVRDVLREIREGASNERLAGNNGALINVNFEVSVSAAQNASKQTSSGLGIMIYSVINASRNVKKIDSSDKTQLNKLSFTIPLLINNSKNI
jgi:hypothetical protein